MPDVNNGSWVSPKPYSLSLFVLFSLTVEVGKRQRRNTDKSSPIIMKVVNLFIVILCCPQIMGTQVLFTCMVFVP